MFVARSAGEARDIIKRVRRDCLSAHVNINFEKSQLIPVHKLAKHLGSSIEFAGDGTIDVLRTDVTTSKKASPASGEVPRGERGSQSISWLASSPDG